MSAILRVPLQHRETKEIFSGNLFCLWSDGIWAVCQDLKYDDSLTVTHVPTGYQALDRIDSIDDGRHLIEALERSDVDWNFTDPAVALAQPTHQAARVICQQMLLALRLSGAEDARASYVAKKPLPDNWTVEVEIHSRSQN